MQKKVRSLKAVSLLAFGGMLLQFGGCLQSLPEHAWRGFAEELGSIPAQIVYDNYLGGIIDGALGGGDEEAE